MNWVNKQQKTELVSFFDTGLTKQKKMEQDMVLMARIKAESKASADKELNIVISGLKESENEQEAVKENEDAENAEEILSALGINTDGKIKKIYRRGRNQKGPRVVIVELTDKNRRNEAIKCARNLRNVTKYSTVYVNKNLTWSEIEEEKSARIDYF